MLGTLGIQGAVPSTNQAALPLLERALAITEAVLGSDHPSTAIRLSNLAATYRDLGHSADALPLKKRAGQIRQHLR